MLTLGKRVGKVKMMPNIEIINIFVSLLLINLMKDLGLLGGKDSQALNTVHIGLPTLKIREIIQLIHQPIKYNKAIILKPINFLNFLLFPIVI